MMPKFKVGDIIIFKYKRKEFMYELLNVSVPSRIIYIDDFYYHFQPVVHEGHEGYDIDDPFNETILRIDMEWIEYELGIKTLLKNL